MTGIKNVKVTWHGHANFQLEQGGVNILIDPFFTGNPVCKTPWQFIAKPDLVLITHIHADHTGDVIEICNAFNAKLCAVVGAAEIIVGAGVPEELVINSIGFNIGGTVKHKGASITMTEAVHTSEGGVPVGYIITMPNGFTIYHAGDTGIFCNMKVWGELYPIDLAILPTGGLFTMDMREAAKAARFLNAKRVIPMHYGTFPTLASDMSMFENELSQCSGGETPCECCILSPGDSITF